MKRKNIYSLVIGMLSSLSFGVVPTLKELCGEVLILNNDLPKHVVKKVDDLLETTSLGSELFVFDNYSINHVDLKVDV